MLSQTIALNIAQNRISAWRQDQVAIQNWLYTQGSSLFNLPELTAKAFTFYLEDFQNLLERINIYNTGVALGYMTGISQAKVNAIRIYPGNYDQSVGRMMGVAVTNFTPALNTGGVDVVQLPTVEGDGIYDVSHPCPELYPELGIMEQELDIPAGPAFTISLTDAQGRIQKWQEDQTNLRSALQGNPLVISPVVNMVSAAFHLDDLQQMVNDIYVFNGWEPLPIPEPIVTNPVNAVRFYFGKVEAGAPVPPYACLMAVAVTNFDYNGNNGGDDVIMLPVSGAHPDYQSSIYDFSYPCPPTCPNPGKSIMDYNG